MTLRPTATGKLGRTPLVELLIYMASRNLSGTLVVDFPEVGKTGIVFERGVPTKAQTEQRAHLLGERLVKANSVPRSAVLDALDRAGSEPLGERLTRAGVIDEAGLTAALLSQLDAKLTFTAQLPGGAAFAFFEGKDLLPRWQPVLAERDPLPWIWKTGAYAPLDRCQSTLKRLGDHPLKLHPHSAAPRFEFGPSLKAMLDVMRVKPHTLADLRATGLADSAELDRMLHVLALTRHLDLGTVGSFPLGVDRAKALESRARQQDSAERWARRTGARSSLRTGNRAARVDELNATGPTNPAPPAEIDASERHEGHELKDYAARLDSIDHYELLGVQRQATATDVAQAFFQRAKRWHPDKIKAIDPELTEVATRVFARISEAHQVLSDQTRREQYDATLSGELENEQAEVRQVLGAASAFQRAEILVKRHDYVGALKLAEQAYQDDPEQAEYAAIVAWLRCQTPDARQTRDFSGALEMLDAAVVQQPENVRVRMYRAAVLKQAGRDRDAIKDYRWVIEIDPKNLEAAREIRLNRMRRERSTGATPKASDDSSLLGRWLKR